MGMDALLLMGECAGEAGLRGSLEGDEMGMGGWRGHRGASFERLIDYVHLCPCICDCVL